MSIAFCTEIKSGLVAAQLSHGFSRNDLATPSAARRLTRLSGCLRGLKRTLGL